MVFNIVLAIVACLALWSAKSLHATAARFYRGMPLSFFPQVGRAIRERVTVAVAILVWIILRVWG